VDGSVPGPAVVALVELDAAEGRGLAQALDGPVALGVPDAGRERIGHGPTLERRPVQIFMSIAVDVNAFLV
jgi:hypothetical protein